jgi:hypothetical protein
VDRDTLFDVRRRTARGHAATGAAPRACLALVLALGGSARAQAPAQPPPWRLRLAAEGALDTNPRLVADSSADARRAESARVQAQLERNLSLPRTRLALRADGSRLAYRQAPDLTRTTWGLEGQTAFAFSPRLGLSLGGARRNDQSRDLRNLTDTGFVLGQVLTRTRRGSGELRWRAREHVTLAAAGRYERYDFDGTSLVGGSTREGDLRLDFAPWRHASLSLAAQAALQRRAQAAGLERASDGTTRSLLATWTYGPPERVQASLSGGVTRLVPLGDSATHTLTLVAAGSLRAKRGRHTFGAQFDRRASQAFGLGRSALTFGLAVSDSYALTPRLDAGARGNWSRTTDPARPAFDLRTWGAAAELGWRAAPRVRVRGAYTLFRGEERGSPARTNHVVAVSISHERTW